MKKLVDDQDFCLLLGKKASCYIRQNFSHRATGLRYYDRIKQIKNLIGQTKK